MNGTPASPETLEALRCAVHALSRCGFLSFPSHRFDYAWQIEPPSLIADGMSYGLGFAVGLIRFALRWGDRQGKVPEVEYGRTN